jgi:hypothetical protein
VKHGPAYLTRNELNERVSRHLSDYYDSLGKSLTLGRDKMFWSYHKTKLTEAGVGFSHIRVVRGAVAILVDALLNPKHSVEKLLSHRSNHTHARTPESTRITSSGMEDWAASQRLTGD